MRKGPRPAITRGRENAALAFRQHSYRLPLGIAESGCEAADRKEETERHVCSILALGREVKRNPPISRTRGGLKQGSTQNRDGVPHRVFAESGLPHLTPTLSAPNGAERERAPPGFYALGRLAHSFPEADFLVEPVLFEAAEISG